MFEPGETDPLEVLRIPLTEAVKMVMDGRINANSTAHLILKAEGMGAWHHKLLMISQAEMQVLDKNVVKL